jgi:hypothetical protein
MRIATRAGLALCLLTGCGDDGSGGPGSLRVKLVAEATITDGLKAGQDEENTRDYGVSYSKFLVAIGRVKLARAGGETRADSAAYIADLRSIGTTGIDLSTFADLPSGQWDQFGFETPQAGAGFQKLGGVSDADAQQMIDQQLTYWIEGTVQNPTRPVNFVFKIPVGSAYSDCENDGEPGVTVTEGRVSTAKITVHGDHAWFDSLVRGDETTVTRRAAWLVQADKDGDGMVSTDDLKQVRAEDVFPSSQGYNLSGGVLPVATAYDFVRAQLASQGHLNVEGECVTTPL